MSLRARMPATLRGRLLVATMVAVVLALAAAGVLLQQLFQAHAMRQFQHGLQAQLDLLTARVVWDQGRIEVPAAALLDPRWSRPYGGLYGQIDRLPPAGMRRPGAAQASASTQTPSPALTPTPAPAPSPSRANASTANAGPSASLPAPAAGGVGVWRSRSLWDHTLALPADRLDDGMVHVHALAGPRGLPVLALERTVRPDDLPDAALRLAVAADLTPVLQSAAEFRGVLAMSLGVLGLLLVSAAWAQGRVALAPLRPLASALQAVRSGEASRLEGRFPAEIQPLVDDFNRVLERQTQQLAQARTQAGNLAHALKTPLAVLQQAAQQTSGTEGSALAAQVQEQVALARRQVDVHLARARAAAAHGLPGQRAAVMPAVDGLLRLMRQLHADRTLVLQSHGDDASVLFAGDAQDLQEMLGNLLDNACRWSAGRVEVTLEADAPSVAAPEGRRHLRLHVDDDGPGIAAEQRALALQRGMRLDESVAGSGLGLAIVAELAELYDGRLALDASPLGGLRASLHLPRAADARPPSPRPRAPAA